MPTAALKDPSAFAEKAADVIRNATQLTGDARRLKTAATDALEDGLHTAKRAVTTARRDAAELKDEAVYRIKREPFKAVGIAFAAGLGMGALIAAIVRRPRLAKEACHDRE